MMTITFLQTRIQYLMKPHGSHTQQTCSNAEGVGGGEEAAAAAAAAAAEEEEEEEATNKMHTHEKRHESLFRRLPRSTSHRFCE
jgi:hypothetical protein